MGPSTASATQHYSVKAREEGVYLLEASLRPMLPEAHVRPVAIKQLPPGEMPLPQLPQLLAAHLTTKVFFEHPSAALALLYLLPACLPATAESCPPRLLAQSHAALQSIIAGLLRLIVAYFEVRSPSL
jgi:hypothetical protein